MAMHPVKLACDHQNWTPLPVAHSLADHNCTVYIFFGYSPHADSKACWCIQWTKGVAVWKYGLSTVDVISIEDIVFQMQGHSQDWLKGVLNSNLGIS